VRNRSILRRVSDIHGRPTYSDDLLFTYTEQFEKDFAVATQRIIQATEGGVALAGATVMTLRQAAEQYCRRPLPAGLFAEGSDGAGGAAKPQAAAAKAAAELEQRLQELGELRNIAQEMNGLLQKLEGLVERPAEFNRTVARVDVLRTLIQKYETMYRLVVEVCATAELRRYTADRRIGTQLTETPDSARRRLRRDREFVASFLDGCDFLLRLLPEALSRLRERLP